MKKVFKLIVKARYILALIFIVLFTLSLFLMKYVNVNYDVTSYLNENSLTKKALDEMNKEFKESGSFLIMIENITSEKEAIEIKNKLDAIDGVSMILFDYDNTTYHIDDNVLYSISLEYNDYTNEAKEILKETKELLKDYKFYLSGSAVDSQFLGESVMNNMLVILALAAIVVLVILLISSVSWIEPLIFLIVTGVAIIINMGTNVVFSSVSFVTQSICAVMQLALAMDYSIVVLHTYTSFIGTKINEKEAMEKTLEKTFMPILGSSLTTVAGLLALTFINFKMGSDIGITLAKGIVISLLTVFLFMPAVILTFSKLITRTRHRSIIEIIQMKFPKVENKFLRMQMKTKMLVPSILLVLIIGGFFFNMKTEYAFTLDSSNDSQSKINIEKKKIEDVFGIKNQGVILLPKDANKDMTNEKIVIDILNKHNDIDSIQGIASLGLYDDFSANEISEKYNIQLDIVNMIFSNLGKEKLKLIELLEYLNSNDLFTSYGETLQKNVDDYYEKSQFLTQQVTVTSLRELINETSAISLDKTNVEFLLSDLISKKLITENATYKELINALLTQKYFNNIFLEYESFIKINDELKTTYTKKELIEKFSITEKYWYLFNNLDDSLKLEEFVTIIESEIDSQGLEHLEIIDEYYKVMNLSKQILTKDEAQSFKNGYLKLYPKVLFNLIFLSNKKLTYGEIINKIYHNQVIKITFKSLNDKLEEYQEQINLLEKEYTKDDVVKLGLKEEYFDDDFTKITGEKLLQVLSEEKLLFKSASDLKEDFKKVYESVQYALKMFESDKYSRIVFNIKYDSKNPEVYEVLDSLSQEINEENLYSEYYLFGQSSAFKEFELTFDKDSLIINIISFIFIFVILLFSFKSIVIPIILTMIIEGAIWVTMSINYFSGEKVYFICYLLVVCIQMGSTIDYGIILTNNYINERKENAKEESLKNAFNTSLPTILTSGTILMLASMLVGIFSEVSIISEIGYLLSLGTLVSVIFILLGLPQVLYLLDKIIEKGSYKYKFKEKENGNNRK